MRKTFIVAALVLLTGILSVCEKREDSQSVLDVAAPPQPDNLVVTRVDNINYTLTWTVDDPDNVVKEYKVYLITSFAPPDLLDSIEETSTGVNTVVEIPGLIFGVSVVTIGNVESAITTEPAPAL